MDAEEVMSTEMGTSLYSSQRVQWDEGTSLMSLMRRGRDVRGLGDQLVWGIGTWRLGWLMTSLSKT